MNATKHYQSVLHIDPRRAPIHTQLGHALKEQGDWKEAERHYGIAVTQKPSDPDPYLHRGNALVQIDRAADAEAVYLCGLRQSEALPDSNERQRIQRRIHVVIADMGRSTRDWKKVISHYREALAIDSVDAKIWVQLAHALKENDDLGSGEVAYWRAVALEPLTLDTYVSLCPLLARRYQKAEQEARAGMHAVRTERDEALAHLDSSRKREE